MRFCNRILALFLISVMMLSSAAFSVYAAPNGTGEYRIDVGASAFLYVRSGPDKNYSSIGKLYDGQSVNVLEIANTNWGKVSVAGNYGWICLDYANKLTADSVPGKQYTLSAEGLQLIKDFEGYAQFKYWDGGHYTIGYGSTCYENDYPNGITEPEASALILATMPSYEANLDSFLTKYNIKVSQKQYDALVSFTYNFGNPWVRWDEFDLKTILINGAHRSTPEAIKNAFGQFVKAGGNVLPGLVSRRAREAELFIEGTAFSETKSFKDVYTHSWYFNAVEYVNEKGIMTGVTGGSFKPGDLLSRSMMVTILGKIEKIDTSAYSNKTNFEDVKVTDWFAPYVEWAYVNGITNGTGDGEFSPNVPITRQDIVVMLYMYTQKKGIETMGFTDNTDKYADTADIASYAVPAMKWAVGCGCIAGNDSNELDPGNNASRAEAAQIMKNYNEKVMA
ncbi:MAG: S-layer homology domain-containing protein [Clostridia bacterium]|nr:S-layer homology domain-containing protein [Clostridia bacterium]